VRNTKLRVATAAFAAVASLAIVAPPASAIAPAPTQPVAGDGRGGGGDGWRGGDWRGRGGDWRSYHRDLRYFCWWFVNRYWDDRDRHSRDEWRIYYQCLWYLYGRRHGGGGGHGGR
jgi:hypothetical protein